MAINAPSASTCWGDVAGGACGNVPTETDFVHIDVDEFQSRALRADGTLFTWTSTTPASSGTGALFDRYRGAPLAEDEKSLAYRLRFESVDDPLDEDAVQPAVERVIAVLSERLGARQRA